MNCSAGMACCLRVAFVVLVLATYSAHSFNGMKLFQQLKAIRPACCQRGPKLIEEVILCDAPCCPGLHEMRTTSMPHMTEFIWCENIEESRESRVKQKIRSTASRSPRLLFRGDIGPLPIYDAGGDTWPRN